MKRTNAPVMSSVRAQQRVCHRQALSLVSIVACTAMIVACNSDQTSSGAFADAGGRIAIDGGASDAGFENGRDASPRSDPDPGVEFAAGTRLRPKFLTFDHAKIFEGWHDSQLDQACEFTDTAFGTACVPRTLQVAVFSDSGCTRALMSAGSEDAPEGYARTYERDPCKERYTAQLFKRGAPLAQPPATLYGIGFNGCEALSNFDSSATWYQAAPLTSVEARELFVFEKRLAKVGTERIQARYRLASDGAVERLGWYDREIDQTCGPQPLDGEIRCVPFSTSVVSGQRFLNPTCTGAPLRQVFSRCLGDQFVVERDFSQCPTVSRVLEQKELLPYSVAFQRVAGTCQQRVTDAPLWEVNVWESQRFASLRAEDESGNRILARPLTAFGERGFVPSPNGPFFDSQAGLECFPALDRNGQLRCLPGGYNDMYYADESCSKEVTTIVGDRCADTTAVQFVYSQEKWDGPGRVYQTQGSPPRKATLYRRTQLGCERDSYSSDNVYDVTEVDPAQFAEGSRSIE